MYHCRVCGFTADSFSFQGHSWYCSSVCLECGEKYRTILGHKCAWYKKLFQSCCRHHKQKMFASLSNSTEMLRALIPENKKIAFALNGGKDSYVCADLVLKENIKVDVWFFWDQGEMDEVKFELDRFLEQTNIDLFVLPSNSSLFANMKSVLTWLKKEFGIEVCIDGKNKKVCLF